jgi:putative N6-adenine-specific DNA methylase
MECNDVSDWKRDEALVNPLCGSGTIPIEAGLMAANVAPGINRSFAFMNWPSGNPGLWQRLIDEAAGAIRSPNRPICGSDIEAGTVCAARRNVERAGVSEVVYIEKESVYELGPKQGPGLLLSNPP